MRAKKKYYKLLLQYILQKVYAKCFCSFICPIQNAHFLVELTCVFQSYKLQYISARRPCYNIIKNPIIWCSINKYMLVNLNSHFPHGEDTNIRRCSQKKATCFIQLSPYIPCDLVRRFRPTIQSCQIIERVKNGVIISLIKKD